MIRAPALYARKRAQSIRPAEFQEKALGFAPSWESLCVLMMLRSGQHGLNS